MDGCLIGIPNRVIVLEDSFDGMVSTFGEAIVEKVWRVKEDFANLGDKISYKITKLQSYNVTKLQSYKVTKLQSYKVTKLQS